MAKKPLTIGGALSFIVAVGIIFWVASIFGRVTQDPTNPEVIANITVEATEKIVDEAIPTPIKIILWIVSIFGGGVIATILIIVVVRGWDYLMNIKIPLHY